MTKGKITYCLVDGTDPSEKFECEGRVINAFFDTSRAFDKKNSRSFVQPKGDLRVPNKMKSDKPRADKDAP